MERFKRGKVFLIQNSKEESFIWLSFCSKVKLAGEMNNGKRAGQISPGWSKWGMTAFPSPNRLPLFKGESKRLCIWSPVLRKGAREQNSGLGSPTSCTVPLSHQLMPAINPPLALRGLIHSSVVRGWALPLRDWNNSADRSGVMQRALLQSLFFFSWAI